MSNIVISVENLSKVYRLGQIGTGTLSHDLNVWWARVRGKPSPLLRIGETDHGNQYGEETWALKDVSFNVEQGEVLGIIGRNGAGKSTLLKILSRVTAPTSGRIKVKGRIASLLEVGTGFHPDLTGRENIFLNGTILGMSRKEIDRKFDEIVDFSGVDKFIDTPIKRYSSGMFVRLAFAVAAHLDPEILLVDEVLAVGDAAFQKKCLGKMGDVAKEGRTVLFVSHNMGAIQSICSNVLWIDAGSLIVNNSSKYVVDLYIEKTTQKNIESRVANRKVTPNKVRINDFRLLGADGSLTETVSVGDSISLEVDFNSVSDVQNPIFMFLIRDQMGNPVSLVSSFYSYGMTPKISKGGTVKVKVKDINLSPGNYSCDVIIEVYGERLDWIDNALQFLIIPSLFYETGQFPPSGFGIVCLSCQWYTDYE